MKHSRNPTATALLIVLILFLTTLTTQSQSVNNYDLTWWSVDGGGQTADPGDEDYTLSSTIGQYDAKVWQDDDYTLTGGFWGGAVATEYNIYLPLILRDW